MNNVKQLGKLDSMLLRFSHGERHHRFTAEGVGDHTLHSTVSDLQKRYGIYFARVWVKVPNRFGGTTRVKKYWLEGEHLEKAQRIAAALKEKPTKA